LQFFEQMVGQLERTFRIQPKIIACDMHPGYLSTRWAKSQISNLRSQVLFVQHHHAHIASVMAENGLTGGCSVIGVAFDGTGYGTDGAIWGGEFLVADYASFRRAAHLKYVPLPGGDAAVRRPYRTALAHMWAAGIAWDDVLPPVKEASLSERAILEQQLRREVSVVPTSSVGRLFDAVSALVGVRQEVNYEAQAAIELEMLVESAVGDVEAYPFRLAGEEINPAPCIGAVVADVRAGIPVSVIAARFHLGLARMIRDVCLRIRREAGLCGVALSGGVFQNVTLLGMVLPLLNEAGFTVYTHHVLPPNDACVSLGQAVVADAKS
jgi:hydrogenase maturation protein HypF